MNPFDILILVVLAWALCRGIFRGFIREAASIIGVIAGFYLAYTYYPRLSLFLLEWVKQNPLLHPMSFALIFLLVLMVVNLLAAGIRQLMSLALLGWVDRFLGAAFGFVKGMVVVVVLFALITTFMPVNAPVLRDSVLIHGVAEAADVLIGMVPEGLKLTYERNMESIRRLW